MAERRATEQSVLYRLTDRLHRARSTADVYEAALDAIDAALGCTRASILLFDGAGVMRFVAWRGLSDRYRAAVEGHSPWAADAADPEPICISDVATADLAPDLRKVVRAAGIGALAFIPLASGGRLIGKFMTYYSEPHPFGAPEIELSLAIARQFTFSLARVMAEQALKNKEAELELIMNNTPFMMTRCTPNLTYRFVSPAYAHMLDKDAADLVGKSIADVLGAKGFAAIEPHIARVLKGERVEWEEELDLGPAGVRFMRAVYLPDVDAQGHVVGWIGSLLDMTDRRRAEQAARRLASIVETSDDAIVSKDLNGIVTSWNSGAERLFGYRAEEMIGRPIATLIPDDRQDEEPTILARLRTGERVDHFETVRRRKDGTLRDISLTISPVKDGRGTVIGASKIARDITERKQAETALRQSQQRLQDLLAAIPAAIYTTDADGTITYFNEAAVEMSGRRPEVGVDKWCVTWKLFWPDGTPLPHDQCPMAIALKEGRLIRNVEAIAERPDGSRVPFIPYPTPLLDASGKVAGGINMLVDISERKQSETHQRVLLRELNHRVKNNMQILHVLLNSALRATQSVEARTVLEDASRRVGAMAAAQQVLYATPGGTTFSIDDFLRTVCRTAQQTFASNAAFTIEPAEGTLSNDSAAPLALILNELLTNAVKHGLKGEKGDIRVGVSQDKDTLTLYVEDDGPGFELAAAARRSSGLSLVQALARQLKGRIEVTREGATRCAVVFPEPQHASV
jgi:PAS domain S-box-containing protein